MTKSTVYVETTVISYLAASPSRDIVLAGHQATTRAWWSRRDRFDLFVSQAVVEEAARGNAAAAAKRLTFLEGIRYSDQTRKSTRSRTNYFDRAQFRPTLGLTRFTLRWPP